MKAVILAAGRGTRLRPITDRTHKSLLKVGHSEILIKQIKNYCRQGVDKIYVVTGYRSKDISRQIQDIHQEISPSTGIEVIQSERWYKTDSLYSLFLTEEYVRGEPFVLSNGDVVADKEIFEILCSEPETAIIPYDSEEFESNEPNLDLKYGRPAKILDKSKRNGAGSTIGMFAFNEIASQSLFAGIQSHIDIHRENKQWFEVALDRILPEIKFKAIDVSIYDWAEIDTIEDLENAWEIWEHDTPEMSEYINDITSNTEQFKW